MVMVLVVVVVVVVRSLLGMEVASPFIASVSARVWREEDGGTSCSRWCDNNEGDDCVLWVWMC